MQTRAAEQVYKMVYLTRRDRIEILAKALWDIVDQRGDYCIHIPWENVPADDKAEWRGRAAEVLDDLRIEMRNDR